MSCLCLAFWSILTWGSGQRGEEKAAAHRGHYPSWGKTPALDLAAPTKGRGCHRGPGFFSSAGDACPCPRSQTAPQPHAHLTWFWGFKTANSKPGVRAAVVPVTDLQPREAAGGAAPHWRLPRSVGHTEQIFVQHN